MVRRGKAWQVLYGVVRAWKGVVRGGNVPLEVISLEAVEP